MKKYITIAALLVAGTACANAATTLDKIDAYFLHMNNTNALVDSLTSNRGQLWFKADAATLGSWMVEFSLTKLGHGNKTLFATSFGDTGQSNERYGLGVYSWWDQTGVTIGKDDSHFSGAANLTFDNPQTTDVTETLSAQNPYQYRLAYDASANTAYLYCVNTGTLTSVTTTVDYNLTSATKGGTKDQKGVSSFWTDAGAHGFSDLAVYDMSSLAGDATKFSTAVQTLTVVPEPSAFGLLAGIGALALVASRRRRK